MATIYKNVNAMVEKIFLNEVKVPDAKTVYELVKEEHSHLVCSSCGRIEDIVIDTSVLNSSLASVSNFKINNTEVIFQGICEKMSIIQDSL